MESLNKLAYFLEEETVRSIFRDWPVGIGIVMCLDESGGCDILVYHTDEGHSVLRKVAAVLECPLGQFQVFPPIDGYVTRQVRFTEEQRLLTLVADVPDLRETASDYAANYQFSPENGAGPLETARFDFAKARIDNSPRDQAHKSRITLSDVREKSFHSGEISLPHGYFVSAGSPFEECAFIEGQLFLKGDSVRLIVTPEKVTINTKPIRVAEIGFRDDFARFVLPTSAMNGWKCGMALVLDMAVDRFPVALVERLKSRTWTADITLTRQGVFVMPSVRVVEWAEPENSRSFVGRILTPMRMTFLCLAGLGALTGTVLSALQPPIPASSISVERSPESAADGSDIAGASALRSK